MINYGYDAYGRRSQLTYPDGVNYVTYGYDAGDELTGVYESGSTQLAGFDYDDYGRRSHLYRGNGITTTYGYDSNLRLGTLTQGSSGAAFYNQVTYGYNAADQIASKAGSNSSYNYTPAARSIGYGIDGLNRIASVNGTNFSYDGRGNLSGDGSGSTYGYNVDNLLTSATQSSVTSTLTYDPANRLYKISKQNGATTQFLYDGSDLIAEYDGSGNLLRRYVHGPGDDEPLVMYDYTNGGAKTYLHADDNGTVNLITSASGSQVAINTYDEYGLPGSGNTGRFQYTGQAWLSEIGMYYYKARLYNPAIGRFMQTDPIGYADGMNWYNYVHGDPVNHFDPTGTDCTDARTGDCHPVDCTGNLACSLFQHMFGNGGWINAEGQYTSVSRGGSGFSNDDNFYAGASLETAFPMTPQAGQYFYNHPVTTAAIVGGGAVCGGVLIACHASGACEVAEGGAALAGAADIAVNAVPGTLARVIPEGIPASTLGAPGASDVFVTAADDVEGMNSEQIAERLTIPRSPSGCNVITFATPEEGLASPILRENPGFVGNGFTAGGAREFVLPNGPIPEGANMCTVK